MGTIRKPRSLKSVQSIANKVEGWLGTREGRYLWALANIGSYKGAIVEIGSWKGKSTIWLAEGSLTGNKAKVVSIDPHTIGPDQKNLGYKDINTEKEFTDNIKKYNLEDVVVPIVDYSESAVNQFTGKIGLLWIDGDHSYNSCLQDFTLWEPYVEPGGIIAFHDTYSWEGVIKIVDNIIFKSNNFAIVGQVDSILAIKKTDRLTIMALVKRKTFIILRNIYLYGRSQRKHWRALPKKILRGLSTYYI